MGYLSNLFINPICVYCNLKKNKNLAANSDYCILEYHQKAM